MKFFDDCFIKNMHFSMTARRDRGDPSDRHDNEACKMGARNSVSETPGAGSYVSYSEGARLWLLNLHLSRLSRNMLGRRLKMDPTVSDRIPNLDVSSRMCWLSLYAIILMGFLLRLHASQTCRFD